MEKVLMQFLKLNFLLALFLSLNASAEVYDAQEFINLDGSICKKPNKHLTLADSGFFEYIGASDEQIFECGKSPGEGDQLCKKDPELICRNQYKNNILQRSDALIISANNFLASSEKSKNRKKLNRAIKKQTSINQSWKNSQDILTLIDSLEREIIFTSSLLPAASLEPINQDLQQKHNRKRQEILEERRIKANKIALNQAEEASMVRLALEQSQAEEEQINIILFICGIMAIIVLIGVLSNKWILFDSEKDFFMTLGSLISGVVFISMLDSNGASEAISFSGKAFHWSIVVISGLLLIAFIINTFLISIKGNGVFVGSFIYIFKVLFCLVLSLFIIGKIGEITGNKDKRTTANRTPVLAVLALIAIFWKPIKSILINGDKVRAKRQIH